MVQTPEVKNENVFGVEETNCDNHLAYYGTELITTIKKFYYSADTWNKKWKILRVEETKCDKHSSLLRNGINYSHKKVL
jgi:hypothetical protein